MHTPIHSHLEWPIHFFWQVEENQRTSIYLCDVCTFTNYFIRATSTPAPFFAVVSQPITWQHDNVYNPTDAGLVKGKMTFSSPCSWLTGEKRDVVVL